MGCFFLAAGLVWLPSGATAQTKQIRLRNETIVTSPGPAHAAGQVQMQGLQASAPASGLFLVQFENPLESDGRAQLRALGVQLVKYVPDDAFIARFNRVAPDTVRALKFVRWVEPYRSNYKVHPHLTAFARATIAAGQVVAVNVLLSPDADSVEISQVRSLLTSIQQESHLRQGILLRGEMPPGQVEALSQSSAVLWVEPAPRRKPVDELASKIVGGDDGRTGTRTLTEQSGFDGSGVVVCVADTGLDTGVTNTMHPDLRGRVTGFRPYGALPDGSDGYGHGTHCAGIIAGNAATGETDPDTGAFYGLGVASGASLFIERIFDDNANEVSPFPSDETMTRDAVRNGAKIGSNSWGNDTQGAYDTDAAQFDELVRDADAGTPGDQPYILEFSAGNAGSGSQTVGSPATGKNVITTGASENVPGTLALTYGLYADGADFMADFSSRGPCEDGRIKPDVVAPGTWIASAAASAAPDEASIAWTTIDGYYVFMGGTSMSGPYAAGAAAVFVQFYKSTHTNALPSPALVKAALINSAGELDESNGGPGPIPNFDEGWGRITLTNVVTTNANTAPRFYQYVDQSALLTSGQVYLQHVFVQNPGQPLKITLAYTDVAGFPGAIPALVNDLDLEVLGPDGTLYRGNQFAADESIPNPPLADNLNNVEGVHLAQPAPGDYLVRVRARSVVEDARLDTAAIDQDFALVMSGDLARPGMGFILLDRTNYTAPGTMQITVLDAARGSSGSVNVVVKSTTEPAGEIYTLNSAGSYGAFTGAVATVVGGGGADGKLQIHNGDAIEADYVDSAGSNRIARATAQLVPPVLTGVATTNVFGFTTIQWQSSQPANSIVRYSTNLTFNLAATNAALTLSHTIKLTRLVPGKTYNFFVSSTDAAGNTTTNNNSGAYYSFVASTTPTVLLVDDYDSAGEADDGSTVIPDSSYTNTLTAAGFSYAFWKVNQRGYPQLLDLQGFPAVIWRTTDDIINYTGTHNTLTPPQQFMVQTYLNQGGSFFMASMNILSQLGNVSFRQHVLQVNKFGQNPDPPAPCSACDEDFGVPAVLGAPGNPITSGMGMTLDYTSYPSFDIDSEFILGPDFSDTFIPAGVASPILFESVSGKPCGMSYPRIGQDSPGRVVFLSVPLDTIPVGGTSPNNRTILLRNILNFLAPGAVGKGTLVLDNITYSIPDTVSVEIGDSDLVGTGQTQATFSTSSTTNKVIVTLNETAHPGLFRGSIVLVATNAAGNQLAVRNGDIVTAKYFDASNNSNVVATATIDTVAPVISQVSATTSFAGATVTWHTSKPADSLVQYAESTLPDRTAFLGTLVTNHSVAIGGLAANRVYFFQVASRDAAGNTTVDDNQGALYSFQTLQAPRPPWFDNLESGALNWSVVPDPSGTDLNWQLGKPNNGLSTTAVSGTNAWGSNLKGQSFGIASSFLYSPVIDLSGVSQVTLTFWDNFDFSSGLEDGQLGISTNSSTPPASIPTLVDFAGETSGGWQQETVDLTPFIGKTIQVVWYYQGVSIFGPLDGWLLDDIAITAVSGGGTITITKNLGQGSFTLSGPINQSGTAISTTVTNAPPGQYSVQFGDAPFYMTPATQSSNLVNGATVNFMGNYSFIDLNHNGISDAWENYYFGSTSSNSNQFTDSDHDRMSDYAEFIAGTDPTNAASRLIMLSATIQTNQFQLKWAAIPGRIYQVESSTNLTTWVPVTGWLQASVSPMSYSATNSNSRRSFFRVQVRP